MAAFLFGGLWQWVVAEINLQAACNTVITVVSRSLSKSLCWNVASRPNIGCVVKNATLLSQLIIILRFSVPQSKVSSLIISWYQKGGKVLSLSSLSSCLLKKFKIPVSNQPQHTELTISCNYICRRGCIMIYTPGAWSSCSKNNESNPPPRRHRSRAKPGFKPQLDCSNQNSNPRSIA